MYLSIAYHIPNELQKITNQIPKQNIVKILLTLLSNIIFRMNYMYTQQQKKRENLLVLNWLKIKHVEFKTYKLRVKLTVYYTVSFTCNIYFFNSTYFIFNQFWE